MAHLRVRIGRDPSRSGSWRSGAGTALRRRARARRNLCERRAGVCRDVRDRRARTRGLGAGRAVHRDVVAPARSSSRALRGPLRPRSRVARAFGPDDGSGCAVGGPTSRHTGGRPAPRQRATCFPDLACPEPEPFRSLAHARRSHSSVRSSARAIVRDPEANNAADSPKNTNAGPGMKARTTPTANATTAKIGRSQRASAERDLSASRWRW
jgi:hypothetical protein